MEPVSSREKKIKVILEEGSYGNSVQFALKRESLEAKGQFKSHVCMHMYGFDSFLKRTT